MALDAPQFDVQMMGGRKVRLIAPRATPGSTLAARAIALGHCRMVFKGFSA